MLVGSISLVNVIVSSIVFVFISSLANNAIAISLLGASIFLLFNEFNLLFAFSFWACALVYTIGSNVSFLILFKVIALFVTFISAPLFVSITAFVFNSVFTPLLLVKEGASCLFLALNKRTPITTSKIAATDAHLLNVTVAHKGFICADFLYRLFLKSESISIFVGVVRKAPCHCFTLDCKEVFADNLLSKLAFSSLVISFSKYAIHCSSCSLNLYNENLFS